MDLKIGQTYYFPVRIPRKGAELQCLLPQLFPGEGLPTELRPQSGFLVSFDDKTAAIWARTPWTTHGGIIFLDMRLLFETESGAVNMINTIGENVILDDEFPWLFDTKTQMFKQENVKQDD